MRSFAWLVSDKVGFQHMEGQVLHGSVMQTEALIAMEQLQLVHGGLMLSFPSSFFILTY